MNVLEKPELQKNVNCRRTYALNNLINNSKTNIFHSLHNNDGYY